MKPPNPALARHRYRYVLFNADSDMAGEVFLPDDRPEEGTSWTKPLATTNRRVKVFVQKAPDGTPQRRWLYDYKGNPLATEVWKQDFDGTWAWMNLEWAAEYGYDDRGRLVRESYFHSAEVYGELWIHHYNETGLRFLSEEWDYDKTRVIAVELVQPLEEGNLTGWTIAGPNAQWHILYDNGPYEISCHPENPFDRKASGPGLEGETDMKFLTPDLDGYPGTLSVQRTRWVQQPGGGVIGTGLEKRQIVARYSTTLYL